ncbi:type I site-specific deoxyribonuclease [Gammaproteobacteria bacterium]|nr:type I site-specific deoxyribonuclease [Gammaproteobacteria bacterium]
MKFTEAKLETAIIELLGKQGYPHFAGDALNRDDKTQVLLRDDLRAYLAKRYLIDEITPSEIDAIIHQISSLPAQDLYQNNKTFCGWLANGFLFKRQPLKGSEHRSQKDLYIELIDTDFVMDAVNPATEVDQADHDKNIYKIVNQFEIEALTSNGQNAQLRIPDAILYINGLPLVVFEFKSAIREEATLHSAYVQLTTRYRRDIGQLFVYNAVCILSDGVNNKMGNLFAPYEFYYTWRKVSGYELVEQQGINSLYTLIEGLFNKARLLDVVKNFIYFPDTGNKEIKICCRYPQYYAARKLFFNIRLAQKPTGNGQGGTYFGATGCGKSFTMQFLVRLLMKSVEFASPTIVLITDRTDLDGQLSTQFSNAKTFIGDATVVSVHSRENLRAQLKGRNSGGVFLTTIHKFYEDTQLLSDRCNIICISDEAHRSQINLDQKVKVTDTGVKRSFGFAKYLHDSLPNATYVGFTGTPIDATLAVFGEIIDSYTMTESVDDEITVRIVYEGRAAKVVLDNGKLAEIESYYQECAENGANENQIEESKKASANINAILGDPDRIQALAQDFVEHYEKRINEGATVAGKAMFVASSRQIAYQFYQQLQALRPEWFELKQCCARESLTEKEQRDIVPIERVKMVMTRGKDDAKALYDLLGNKELRTNLEAHFKNQHSNFKIAIVVDMWLTGFDVPFLDTMYIDKPVQKHSLIQTISRVNRKFKGKDKGLVVDYIGIKTQMNLALAIYSKLNETNFEDLQLSIVELRNYLDLIKQIFHGFNYQDYFNGTPLAQLHSLNRAANFVLEIKKRELRFMGLVQRLKAAYDICCGSESVTETERDFIHFYIAIRSIVYKLTRSDAPDTAQMNARVRDMVTEALKSCGVEEIFKLGEDNAQALDIFDPEYLERINKIKLPNTKIQLLQKLLAKAISDFKKVNQLKGINFSEKFQSLVTSYNERRENDALTGDELEVFTDQIILMIHDLKTEMNSFTELDIDFEQKAFYDILVYMAQKYDFSYPEDKLLELAKRMKIIVDDKTSYPDWSEREDIKAQLKVGIMLLLHKFGYPPITCDEIYLGVIAQAESFKKHQMSA